MFLKLTVEQLAQSEGTTWMVGHTERRGIAVITTTHAGYINPKGSIAISCISTVASVRGDDIRPRRHPAETGLGSHMYKELDKLGGC